LSPIGVLHHKQCAPDAVIIDFLSARLELTTTNSHSADAAALGFLYQAQYALLRLWKDSSDDATVHLETLDDVVLESNGQVILEQLKHSLAVKPPAITLASVNVWKTLKAWIDVLPSLDLGRTKFHLVTVADISPASELEVLLTESDSRETLLIALRDEAYRVRNERADAASKGVTPLPHAPRATACAAFLAINDDLQLDILKNARIMPGQSNIRQIEDELVKMLTSVRIKDRAHVAARMVEWWNREIVHAHCGKRPKAIHRHELVDLHMDIVAEVTSDAFVDYYATEIPPPAYQSHPMVARQIELVGGSEAEVRRSVQNEWRAREARSRWSNESPMKKAAIARYDIRLKEEWSDRHVDMCAQCSGQPDEDIALKGKELLSWSHFKAPMEIESIAPTVTAPSYVRGSFQVLSIDGQVGWHPEYRKLLSFDK